MRVVHVLLGLAVAAGAVYHFDTRPVTPPPGQIAPHDPLQVDHIRQAFMSGAYQITPIADFAVEGRVLATERYRMGREADLSPVDFALGWGPMSDSAVLDQLQISQGGRFYFYRWQNPPPLNPAVMATHSANMHMIASSDTVRDQLVDVRPGQVVRLEGFLVRVAARDGWHWSSSTTRNDTGAGACELVWVKRVVLR